MPMSIIHQVYTSQIQRHCLWSIQHTTTITDEDMILTKGSPLKTNIKLYFQIKVYVNVQSLGVDAYNCRV